MNARHIRNAPSRFPRTLDAAFKTPRYAAAIERPWPSFWQRLVQHVRQVLA